MPARKRARRAAVRCAGCRGILAVKDGFDQVFFCDECHPKVDESGVFWYVAHIDHSYVAGSSDEALVPNSTSPLGPSAAQRSASPTAPTS